MNSLVYGHGTICTWTSMCMESLSWCILLGNDKGVDNILNVVFTFSKKWRGAHMGHVSTRVLFVSPKQIEFLKFWLTIIL